MNRFEFYDNVRKFKENQEENSLAHYGTKGQKWGERHWQNPDGTFNEAGKERYFGSSSKKDLSKEKVGSSYSYIDRSVQKAIEDTRRAAEKGVKNLLYQNEDGTLTKKGKKLMDKYDKNPEKYKDKFDKKINPDIIPDKDDEQKNDKVDKKLIKEGEKLKEKFDKADYNERSNLIDNIIKDEKYKETFDKIDQIDNEKNKKALERTEEIFKDYEDEETKHLATAGIMNMLNTPNYPQTMADLGWMAWFYAYEDGNQGANTAEYLYATIDKGVSAKEIGELYNNLHNHDNVKKEALTIIKENPVLSNLDEKYLEGIVSKKLDSKYDDNSKYWNLYGASDGWNKEPNDKQKKDYAEAKKIASKLDSSCGNGNGWDYLNQAIDNLDLSATELKNMTQSDWDRINAEVNRLKK